jgi:hypothetical protein
MWVMHEKKSHHNYEYALVESHKQQDKTYNARESNQSKS